MNNLSVLWPDTLNSSPGNALGQQEEEEEISRDWDTSEAPPIGLALWDCAGVPGSGMKSQLPKL